VKKTLLTLAMLLLVFFAIGHTELFTGNRINAEHRFTTITGETLTVSDFRGKPLLVTFWATDCSSCIKEVPHLIALHERFHPLGLQIIAITMYYDPPSHVVAMTQALRLPYPVVLDLSGSHAQAFGKVALTPTTFLIDGNAKINTQITGKFNENDMSKRIQALLQG